MQRKFNEKLSHAQTYLSLFLNRKDGHRAYMIPEGTAVPDQLLLLEDMRLDRARDYDRVYFLAPREACYKHEFEKLLVDFVMQKNHFCFSLYDSPQGGRSLQRNATGSGTLID